MEELTIYHNPKCSKSRASFEILHDSNRKFSVIEYIKSPPNRDELKLLIQKLRCAPEAMVRTKEETFQSLQTQSPIDLNNEDQVCDFLATHPQLMERPIVVFGNNAVFGRPPENVNMLIGGTNE